MDTTVQEQKAPPKSKLHKILTTVIIMLSVFIVASLSVSVYIVSHHQPAQPRERVLVHPSEELVPAGVTPEDLEQAIQLSKEWAAEFITGDSETGREKLDEMGQLILAGQIAELENNTACLLLETHGTMCKVQLTESPRNGQTYWVPRQCVSRIRTGQDIPMGFCCGAIYLRYLISAAVCCLGIYLLKLKSVFLQITIFIIGMLVINLIWVRIEMLLFL